MMNLETMFSSKTEMWYTPQLFFDALNAIYEFDLDVCAIPENAKCVNYFTPEINGLAQKWIGTCWMNPPYGKEIGKWVAKAYKESLENKNCKIVALLPARTDTRWFHDFIYLMPGVKIDFLKGRLKFGGCNNSAPFPSMLVYFNCN